MTERICLSGADIVTPFRVIPRGVIVIEDGRLDQVGRADVVQVPPRCKRLDLPGRQVVPGYVDLHLHGAGGCDFDRASDEELERGAAALLARGTTSALLTLTPAPTEELLATAERIRAYLEGGTNPLFCGVHVEGPFLNPEMHGALDPAGMWPADPELAELLFDSAGPWLKLMTIAPEMPGAMEIIRRAARRGVVISVGHSRANYQEVEDAIDCGLAQVTHVFNAMPLAHHRDPGVLGAAYTHQQLKVQLIADGVHVHPAIMSFLVKVKGSGSILLVSDAMPASGLPDGDYEFAGRGASSARRDGRRASDGTLAGSALVLDGAVRNMVQSCGLAIGDAARMAGLNPARVLNLDNRKGILAVGHDADMVVLGTGLGAGNDDSGGTRGVPGEVKLRRGSP